MRREVEQHPPSICLQQSRALPPEAGAKFAQDLHYGSDEWHATYATLRNSIEGFSGYVKDGAGEALDDPERRRVRGVAAQSVFVALLLAAANAPKIATFVNEQAAIEAGTCAAFRGVAPRRPSATGYTKRRRWSRARAQTHR